MSGHGFGVGGFILLVVVFPVLAGLVTFGVIYRAFFKQSLSWESWLLGFAFLAVTTAAFFGLIVADVLEEVPAALLLVVVSFGGGRWMIQRAIND